MSDFINRVQNALNVLKAGGMIVLVDDEHRENEGDLVLAAEYVTPTAINFMANHARGLICLSLAETLVDQLGLPMMSVKNETPYNTAFTVSIEAKEGVSTGISAADRAHTILTAVRDDVSANDIITPGHVFPLRARPNGVFSRRGQTEGSVDLMKLAGLKQAAVICEIMNPDGSMSRIQDLKKFVKKHRLPMISIQDILDYRVQTDTLIFEEIATRLPLHHHGEFRMMMFNSLFDDLEHFILMKPWGDGVPLIRVHSECLTGDLLGSLKCDCGPQLDQALDKINREGGILIYLRQEGRGIGLKNKLKAYALQEQGIDTVDANLQLGLPVDGRDYSIVYQILKHFNIHKIRLMTNNPLKLKFLQKFGIKIVKRIPIQIQSNPENQEYLQTKLEKMGHLFSKGRSCKS